MVLKIILLLGLISPINSFSKENWLTSDSKKLCIGKAKDPECTCRASHNNMVTLGGQQETRFKLQENKQEFASYSSAVCTDLKEGDCGHTFQIGHKKVTCEEFVKQLQEKQKSCKGCLILDVALGM
jgi:hypothetical protein